MTDYDKKAAEALAYLHLMVGRCISAWAQLEHDLLDFCTFALMTEDKVAAVVFYQHVNLKPKIELVADLLQVIDTDADLIEKWQTCRKRLDELVPIRNRIAHQPIASSMDLQQDEHGKFHLVTMDHRVVRPFRDKARPKLRGKRELRLDASALEDHWRKVRRLTGDLHLLHGAIVQRGRKRIDDDDELSDD